MYKYIIYVIRWSLIFSLVTLYSNFSLGQQDSQYVPDGYVRVWNDEFNLLSLDREGDGGENWTPWFAGWNARALDGNSDKAWKCDKDYMGGGNDPLGITLHRASNGSLKLYGYETPANKLDNTYGYGYVGGMISGQRSHSQTYGYWECRMKVNLSQGHHWAMWLLPVDDTWPPEIDMVEVIGKETNTVYMNAHGSPQNPPLTTISPIDTWNYHVFGFEWTPTTMRYYLDGVLRKEIPNFVNKPMYWLMTPEIASNWPGLPDNTTTWPTTCEIDYVRIYKQNGSGGNGNNTITIRAGGFYSSGGTIQLQLNNQTVKSWTLGSGLQNFTYTTNLTSANVKVNFLDDRGDARVDYIEIGGQRYQAENQVTNTGVWQGRCGGSFSEVIHCRGYIDFGNKVFNGGGGSTNQNIVVRASGFYSNGGTIQLQLDNQTVKSWTLGASMGNYSYVATQPFTNLKVNFLDDQGDARIDYIEVEGQRYQAENQANNTGVWQGQCGGSFSEVIHCRGYIDFGNVGQLSTANMRMGDLEGDFNLSSQSDLVSKVKIYPNPSSDVLNIDFDAKKEGDAVMEIVNFRGEIVIIKDVHLLQGTNRLNHQITDLPTGNYFIRFRGTGWSSQAQKFIKLLH